MKDKGVGWPPDGTVRVPDVLVPYMGLSLIHI